MARILLKNKWKVNPALAVKALLITIVQRLSPIMLEHLSYEDDLLCPISLVVIDNVKAWKSIKALCDEIGY